MDGAREKLRRVRERLKLAYRDVALLPRIRASKNSADPLLVYSSAIERGVDCGMLVFRSFLLPSSRRAYALPAPFEP
jgi:hypothetical protein